MNDNKDYGWVVVLFVALVVTLIMLFAWFQTAGADGFFQACNYLNDCETFGDMGDFTVKNYKDGILVEGTVPDADLSTTGNPLEIIVTTGDVYTKCGNTGQPYDVTGDILYRGNVVPGNFVMAISLAEGDYNITVYMGQSQCANCPQAKVFPITVKHDTCKPTGEWEYTIPGSNFDCVTEPISPELGGGSWAINRLRNPKYTATFCFRCGVAQVGADHEAITKRAVTTCDVLPECTACP